VGKSSACQNGRKDQPLAEGRKFIGVGGTQPLTLSEESEPPGREKLVGRGTQRGKGRRAQKETVAEKLGGLIS